MTFQEKLIFGAAVVVVSVIATLGFSFLINGKASVQPLGAAGGLLAEHYIPYVATNQGYVSALPITTTGTFSSATTTVSGQVNLTKNHFCFNFYATSTATELHMVASTTATLPHGAAAVMTANYGSCAN